MKPEEPAGSAHTPMMHHGQSRASVRFPGHLRLTYTGTYTAITPTLPADLFGHEHYGAINGALGVTYLLSHALGPLLAGLAWTAFGDSYDRVLLALALVATAGILLYGAATRDHLRELATNKRS